MDKDIVTCIQAIVEDIREQKGIVNEIIRDDVFSVLQDSDCVVLYYPLDDGENGCNGCHLSKPVKGKMRQFVFINTHMSRERQAFTVAHELGHIWKVDELVKDKFPNVNAEDVINRFVAELLMPEKYFHKVIDEYLDKINYDKNGLKISAMLEMIAYLMNYFFVPFKAVVLRFSELDYLSTKNQRVLLKYKDSNALAEIIKAKQYTRLNIVNNLKSLDDLQKYLKKAQEKGIINETKMHNICDEFDIQDVEEAVSKDELIKF